MQTLPPSLWAATAASAPLCAPLTEHAETDVAIVGGGFTGLSAALHLAQQGKDVVVLEAVEPGWGASGRNGGQVNPGLKVLPEEIESQWGRETGARLVTMASATCDLVFELIREHNIDCDAIRPGYVQGSISQSGRKNPRRLGTAMGKAWCRRRITGPTEDHGPVGHGTLPWRFSGRKRRQHSTAVLRSRSCKGGACRGRPCTWLESGQRYQQNLRRMVFAHSARASQRASCCARNQRIHRPCLARACANDRPRTKFCGGH